MNKNKVVEFEGPKESWTDPIKNVLLPTAAAGMMNALKYMDNYLFWTDDDDLSLVKTPSSTKHPEDPYMPRKKLTYTGKRRRPRRKRRYKSRRRKRRRRYRGRRGRLRLNPGMYRAITRIARQANNPPGSWYFKDNVRSVDWDLNTRGATTFNILKKSIVDAGGEIYTIANKYASQEAQLAADRLVYTIGKGSVKFMINNCSNADIVMEIYGHLCTSSTSKTPFNFCEDYMVENQQTGGSGADFYKTFGMTMEHTTYALKKYYKRRLKKRVRIRSGETVMIQYRVTNNKRVDTSTFDDILNTGAEADFVAGISEQISFLFTGIPVYDNLVTGNIANMEGSVKMTIHEAYKIFVKNTQSIPSLDISTDERSTILPGNIRAFLYNILERVVDEA